MKGTTLLYADAGPGLGLGHVLRLYPLFQRMKALQTEAEMLVPLPENRLHELGLVGVREALGGPDVVEKEFTRLQPSVGILDSYRYTNRFSCFLRQRTGCKVVVFDDHYMLEEDVDVVINTSPAADGSRYRQSVAKTFLFGPRFSPIAPAFLGARRGYRVRPVIQNILVALGGDDATNKLDRLVPEVARTAGKNVGVDVLGAELPRYAASGVRAVGWLRQEDLARRAIDYDLAVLAGGTMLHQFACVGMPIISWPQTEKQQEHASAWEKIGSVVVLGRLAEIPALIFSVQSPERRGQLSEAGRRIVDGLGVNRIISHLVP